MPSLEIHEEVLVQCNLLEYQQNSEILYFYVK